MEIVIALVLVVGVGLLLGPRVRAASRAGPRRHVGTLERRRTPRRPRRANRRRPSRAAPCATAERRPRRGPLGRRPRVGRRARYDTAAAARRPPCPPLRRRPGAGRAGRARGADLGRRLRPPPSTLRPRRPPAGSHATCGARALPSAGRRPRPLHHALGPRHRRPRAAPSAAAVPAAPSPHSAHAGRARCTPTRRPTVEPPRRAVPRRTLKSAVAAAAPLDDAEASGAPASTCRPADRPAGAAAFGAGAAPTVTEPKTRQLRGPRTRSCSSPPTRRPASRSWCIGVSSSPPGSFRAPGRRPASARPR
jgi:hypothetical protein